MFTCDKCQRRFRTKQALGGHVGNVHCDHGGNGAAVSAESGAGPAPGQAPQDPAGRVPQGGDPIPIPGRQVGEADQPTVPSGACAPALDGEVVEAEVEEDEGEAIEVRGYLRQGYSYSQLVKDLGFDRRTVRREIAKLVPAERQPQQPVNDGHLPVTVKGTEIITAEAVMQRLSDGSPDWKLRLEGMMLLRAAQKMVMDDVAILRAEAEAESKLIEPIVKLMKETREEQDAAAQRAKDSVQAVAEQAAGQAAGHVARFLDERLSRQEEKKPDIATVQNPIQGVMARALEQIVGRVLGMSASGGQQKGLPSGWTYEETTAGGQA